MRSPSQGFPAAGPSQKNTILPSDLLANRNGKSIGMLAYAIAASRNRNISPSFPAFYASQSKPGIQDDDDDCSSTSTSAKPTYPNLYSLMGAVSVSQEVVEPAGEMQSNVVAEEGEEIDEFENDDVNMESNDVAEEGEEIDEYKDDDVNMEVVKDQGELDELLRNLTVDDLPYNPQDDDGSMPETPETSSEYTTWPDDAKPLGNEGEDSIPDTIEPNTEEIDDTLWASGDTGTSVPVQSPSYHHIHQNDIITAGYLFGREEKTNRRGYVNAEPFIQDSLPPDEIRTTDTSSAMADHAPVYGLSGEARGKSNLFFVPYRNASPSTQTTGGDIVGGNINSYTSVAKKDVFGAVQVQDQTLLQPRVETGDSVSQNHGRDCNITITDRDIDKHHPTGPISTSEATNHVDQSVPVSDFMAAAETIIPPQSRQNRDASVSKIVETNKEARLKGLSRILIETLREEQEQNFWPVLNDLTKFSLSLGGDSSFEQRY